MVGELVEFKYGTVAIALNLKPNNGGVALIGDGLTIQKKATEILFRY